jgi:hypothetical protein
MKLTFCSSYSRLLAYEASRILFRLGCDVRMYDPTGLPIKDDEQDSHPKVQELRELSKWSDGHIWVSPEQHGNLVSTSQLSCQFLANKGLSYRRQYSRTKSTGYLCQQALCVLLKGALWLSHKYLVDPNRLTR